jgi:hypothetical protein
MGPDEEGSWWDRAVDSVESTVSDLAHDAAEVVADVPVLGTVAEAGADMVEGIAQFDGGLLKGAGTLVGGIVNMAEHPVDTVMGLESMAEHIPIMGTPLKAVHEVYDVAVNDKDIGDAISDLNPVNDLNYWENLGSAVIKPYGQEIEEGKYMEAAGRGVFDIGSIILTGGEAAAVEGASDAARVAEEAEVARAAEEAAQTVEEAEVANDADLGTKGTRRNPDGTRKAPDDQFDGIRDKAVKDQRARRRADLEGEDAEGVGTPDFDKMGKSKQIVKDKLKPHNYDPDDWE